MLLLMRLSLLVAVVLLLAFPAGAQPQRSGLSRPMRINPGQLGIEDASLRALVAWDAKSIHVRTESADGAVEAIAWNSLEPRGAFELGRRLIDRKRSDHWTWLGAVMLESGESELAARAFDPALRLDADLVEQIREARRLARRGLDPHEAFAEEAPDDASDDPRTDEPLPAGEPDDGSRRGVEGPYVWPPLSDEELETHTERLKERCEELQEVADVSLRLHETGLFLFYSDLSPGEMQRWSRELDKMYDTLLVTLEIEKGAKLFQGKGVIFVFRERNDFINFERRAFGNPNGARAGGVNHQISGDTFTVFYKHSNEQLFNSVLIHETVHAFMYRYRSSARLPTWANEGLADFIAGHLVRFSNEPSQHWQDARNFVARGGDVGRVLELNYRDGSWPTDTSYQVSHMLVRFMLKHKPRAFKLWIDAIKEGAEWRLALEEQFNVTPDRLAQGFVQDIMSERGYARLE